MEVAFRKYNCKQIVEIQFKLHTQIWSHIVISNLGLGVEQNINSLTFIDLRHFCLCGPLAP